MDFDEKTKFVLVQYHTNVFYSTLNKLKKSDDIVLYSGIFSTLIVNGEMVKSRQFDTLLYSKENDLCLLLMRGGRIKDSDIKKYLDDHDFIYSDLEFDGLNKKYVDPNHIRELFIGQSKNDIHNSAEETIINRKRYKKAGIKPDSLKVSFYPLLEASLSLGYFYGEEVEEGTHHSRQRENIFTLPLHGLVEFEGRLLFLTDNYPFDQVLDNMKNTFGHFQYAADLNLPGKPIDFDEGGKPIIKEKQL